MEIKHAFHFNCTKKREKRSLIVSAIFTRFKKNDIVMFVISKLLSKTFNIYVNPDRLYISIILINTLIMFRANINNVYGFKRWDFITVPDY